MKAGTVIKVEESPEGKCDGCMFQSQGDCPYQLCTLDDGTELIFVEVKE